MKMTEKSTTGLRKSSRGGKPIERYEAPPPPINKKQLGLGPTLAQNEKTPLVKNVVGKKMKKAGSVNLMLKWDRYLKSETWWQTSDRRNFKKVALFNEEKDNADVEWIEKTLDKRSSPGGGKTEFLLKWINKPESEATWASPKRVIDILIKVYQQWTEEKEDYEVEKVLEKRTSENWNYYGTLEYRIKYKGYPTKDATWESGEDGNLEEVIKEFEEGKKTPADKNVELPTSARACKRKSSVANERPKKMSKAKGKK